MSPSLSLVVPCFNEGRRIASSIRELRSWIGPEAEILVVDDGSTDDTVERVTAVADEDPCLRIHHYAPNRGKGAAFRAAAAVALGDKVVFLDADLVFDRASVLRIVDALGDADAAIANRRDDRSRYVVPVSLFGFLYWRHMLGLAFNALVRVALQIRFRDTQCGLKGFRRDALRQIAPSLTVDGFAFDVEMLVVARSLGLRVAEVPVMITYASARSSVHVVRGASGIASGLLRIAVNRWRGQYSPERVRAAAAAGPLMRD